MFACSTKWLTIVLLLAIGVLATGCKTDAETTGPVTAEELSYRSDPLLNDSGVPATSYFSAEPGESDTFERSFENAPPMIPHSLEDLLPITIDDNTCIDCHHPDDAEDAGATAMPASHFYDIRQDKQLDDLAGANFNCTLCHAPQVDSPALVENDFTADFRDQGSSSSSNLLETLNEGVR